MARQPDSTGSCRTHPPGASLFCQYLRETAGAIHLSSEGVASQPQRASKTACSSLRDTCLATPKDQASKLCGDSFGKQVIQKASWHRKAFDQAPIPDLRVGHLPLFAKALDICRPGKRRCRLKLCRSAYEKGEFEGSAYAYWHPKGNIQEQT